MKKQFFFLISGCKLFRIVFYCFIFLFLACANNKATLSYRLYHQLNAKYNAHYHAEETWKQLQKDLEKESEFNYDMRLPLVKTSPLTAQKYSKIYDSIVKKSYQNIELHSLNFNQKELIPIVPAAWLLIAKCYEQLFKFEQAQEIFDRVRNTTQNSELQIQANLGLAASALALGKSEIAYPILFQVDKLLQQEKKMFSWSQKKQQLLSKKITLTLEKQLRLLWMEYFYTQKEYTKALDFLSLAIDQEKRKKIQSRLYFIAAQMAEEAKKNGAFIDYISAIDNYQMVINLNRNHDEKLQAYLNIALLKSTLEPSALNDRIQRTLLKFTKYKENKPYLSGIYFTLSLLAEKWKRPEEAKEYLLLASILTANENLSQGKGALYFKFATVAFNEKKYIQAKEYYSKSLEFLSPTDFNAVLAKNRANTLSAVVKILKEIQKTDTLLMIFQQSPEEKIAWQEEEKKAKQAFRIQEQATEKMRVSDIKDKKLNYFSPQILSKGLNYFMEIWGDRTLIDQWRRSTKIQIVKAENQPDANLIPILDALASEKNDVNQNENSDDNVIFLNTAADFDKANTLQIDRLYQVAVLFKEQVKDTSAAISYFEELFKKYPKNSYRFSVYYQLYRIYQSKNEQDSPEKAQTYANLLYRDCPDCDETQLLQQGSVPQDQQELERTRIHQIYEMAFALYKKGEFVAALQFSDDGLSETAINDEMKNYFLALKAECFKELGRVKELGAL